MAQPTSPTGTAASTAFLGNGLIQDTGDARALLESTDCHVRRSWGSPVGFVLACGNIGAAQPVTTLITNGNFVNPFPYAYLQDILFSCAGHEATPVTCTIDVFDTYAAGTAAANSYLITPFSINVALASGARGASARGQLVPNYYKVFDPNLYPGGAGRRAVWAGDALTAYNTGTRAMPLRLSMGQIFSVRCATTAATGAITALQVTVVLVPSDAPTIDR